MVMQRDFDDKHFKRIQKTKKKPEATATTTTTSTIKY
jgi:hypothetical protein